MKSREETQAPLLSFVYRCLLVLAGFLVLVILVGTLLSVFGGKAGSGNARVKEAAPTLPLGEGEHIFAGIGQMRVPTRDSPPGTVVVFASFVYDPEDKAFFEELALRVKDFREITAGYIGSFSGAELQQLGEDAIKAELLQRYNSILHLGQIEFLYFNDFMIIG